MKSLFAALYGPVFWAGFIDAASCLIAVFHYSHGVLPPLLLLALLTSLLGERYLPYDGAWNHGHGDGGRDVLHALVGAWLSVAPTAPCRMANSGASHSVPCQLSCCNM
ncbi:hypothetical protein [Janthinobacterium sp. ROICE36]|uniref:hypothetical protein n=1 Tax=Janthinobacterium sp. ROICE36 TaxID=2048670 RepID=UPI0011AF8815|nr:hypothetical protein [Janthinobacterium sp. ROICE36]